MGTPARRSARWPTRHCWAEALLLAVLIGTGCGRRAPTANEGDTLLRYIPPQVTLLVGLERTVSEADLKAASSALKGRIGSDLPACFVDVFAKIEHAACGLSLDPAAVYLAVRGRGLRAVAEPCLGTQAAMVNWIDDATGVIVTQPRTTGDASVTGDEAFHDLMTKADRSGSLWGVAKPALFRRLPPGVPSPLGAWVDVGAGGRVEARVTILAPSPADAARFAELGKPYLDSLKLSDATLAVDGDRLVATLPLGRLIENAGGKASAAGAYAAAVGIATGIAVPLFVKAARRTEANP